METNSTNRTDYANDTVIPDNSSESMYYYYYYDYDKEPYKVYVFSDWHVIVLGYVYFILGLSTIIINSLVFFVFVWKKIRTPTSALLTALAISNTLICVSIIPSSMYFHIMNNYTKYVPFRWCVVEHASYIIHQMFRTSSNWLTAVLGIQRCIIVCYPFQAKRYCSMKNTVIAIAVVFVIGIVMFINEAVAIEITPLALPTENNATSVTYGCDRNIPDWYVDSVGDLKASVITNYVCTGVFTRLLPCCVLTVTTVILTYKLLCKDKLITNSANNTSFSEQKVRRATVLIILILIIFLAAELQDVIAFSIYLYELSIDNPRSVLSEEEDKAWDTIGVIFWLLGYHFNSWIFFFMSSQFRSAFRDVYISRLLRPKTLDPSTGVSMLKTTPDSSPRSRPKKHVPKSIERSPESRHFLDETYNSNEV